MKSKTDKQWNRNVESKIRKLKPVKDWLERWIENKSTDWESQCLNADIFGKAIAGC